MIYISENTKDTENIASIFLEKIAKNILEKHATVVFLSGELGAGKTTFTKSFAKVLGIKEKLNSPTFVIMKKYKIPLYKKNKEKNISFKNFFHIDAYRLKNEKDLLHLGWQEILEEKENLIFIEWGEIVFKIIPKKHYKIKIEHTKTGGRKFHIK
jgi:tRNA threonylcarbamoyladenosine biosynthesis protein TsaE